MYKSVILLLRWSLNLLRLAEINSHAQTHSETHEKVISLPSVACSTQREMGSELIVSHKHRAAGETQTRQRLGVSEACRLSEQESCLINDVTETPLGERSGSKHCCRAE